MTAEFSGIFSQLKKVGIVVTPHSLKRHAHQGFMSTVYTVNSNRGELIIHIIKPVEEWMRQRIWEKLVGVNNVVKNFPEIPTSELLLSGKIKDKYFVVQKKLEGRPAGKRTLVNDDVVDMWFGGKGKIYVPQIQKILTRVHKIKLSGYGWPKVVNGKIRGSHKSWRKFFENEVPLWLKSVEIGYRRMKRNRKPDELLKTTGRLAFEAIKKIPHSPPILIHGDSINPSNILAKKNKVTGLLDWEWSIIGDPAWEFCDCGWWPYLNEKSMRPYFKEMGYGKKEGQNFLKRARNYRILWILWGAHMHAKDKSPDLYRVLRKMLNEEKTKKLAQKRKGL